MRASEVPTGGCEEDWAGMHERGGGLRRFCDHCQTEVHDLSSMDERTARTFLSALAGRELCVAYLEDREGEILFADSEGRGGGGSPSSTLVPVARLRTTARALRDARASRSTWLPEWLRGVELANAAGMAGMVGMAGVAGALLGCTPHDRPDEPVRVVDGPKETPVPTVIIPAAPAQSLGGTQPGGLEEPCEDTAGGNHDGPAEVVGRPPDVRKKGKRKRTVGARSSKKSVDTLEL